MYATVHHNTINSGNDESLRTVYRNCEVRFASRNDHPTPLGEHVVKDPYTRYFYKSLGILFYYFLQSYTYMVNDTITET